MDRRTAFVTSLSKMGDTQLALYRSLLSMSAALLLLVEYAHTPMVMCQG